MQGSMALLLVGMLDGVSDEVFDGVFGRVLDGMFDGMSDARFGMAVPRRMDVRPPLCVCQLPQGQSRRRPGGLAGRLSDGKLDGMVHGMFDGMSNEMLEGGQGGWLACWRDGVRPGLQGGGARGKHAGMQA